MTWKIKIEEELASEGVSSGVERENEETKAQEPFDPASISISSKTVALDTVLRRIKNNTIVLNPDFQRNQVWNKERKSLLIESMMLRIPLPMFYVSEDKDGVWEVVDGLQRLSTIRDFILGPDLDGKGFQLDGLEFWGARFDHKNFYAIEKKLNVPRIVNNILEAELSFTVINPETPEMVKRNIFKRINTGGMRLSSQEIRHALYQGYSTKILKTLLFSESYRKIMGKTIKDDRMAGRELILRYLAFHLRGRTVYRGDMDSFLSDTMKRINDISQNVDQQAAFEAQIVFTFNAALERAFAVFGVAVFRRSKGEERKTPINKALFDCLMYCFSRISEQSFSRILHVKSSFLERFYLIINESKFADQIGRHGADVLGVKGRYNEIIKLFEEFIDAENFDDSSIQIIS